MAHTGPGTGPGTGTLGTRQTQHPQAQRHTAHGELVGLQMPAQLETVGDATK